MEIPGFVNTILERLHDAGYESYIVGGAVRDMCLNRPVSDWDVATAAPRDRIEAVFGDIRHFSLKHETVTLVTQEGHYEVTGFRGAGGPVRGIEGDLSHRDFTIDAMAYDPEGKTVLDPYGGRRDLSRRLVRAVGDPRDRFDEDPLRLLRAVRLATELGFEIEANTLGTIRKMVHRLRSVACERIRDELMKILMSGRPSRGFNLMRRAGLLEPILPELLEGYLRRQNDYHRYTIFKHIMETVDRIEPDPALRLTALLHDIAKPRVRTKKEGRYHFYGHEEASGVLAKEIMKRLKFSNGLIDKVTHLVTRHMGVTGYHSGWSDGAVRRLVRRVGPENMKDLLCLRRADIHAHGKGHERRLSLLSELQERIDALTGKERVVRAGDLAIDGNKVMEMLGLNPGPEVGRVLEALMERVMEHPEWNTEERLVALLKEDAMKES
ncbi:MAG: CCA tRNA nucleotidyltransferase [Pseudomonadota bacterium]